MVLSPLIGLYLKFYLPIIDIEYVTSIYYIENDFRSVKVAKLVRQRDY